MKPMEIITKIVVSISGGLLVAAIGWVLAAFGKRGKKIEDLQEKIEKLKGEKKILEDENRRLLREIGGVEERVKGLQSDVKGLKGELEESRRSNTELAKILAHVSSYDKSLDLARQQGNDLTHAEAGDLKFDVKPREHKSYLRLVPGETNNE